MLTKFSVGDRIQGYEHIANDTLINDYIQGTIVSVKKQYYTLDSGKKIHIYQATRFDQDYWDKVARKTLVSYIESAFHKIQANKFPEEKVLEAFKLLFGDNILAIIKERVNKKLNLQ